jgi:hypothetical protein
MYFIDKELKFIDYTHIFDITGFEYTEFIHYSKVKYLNRLHKCLF